MTAKEERDMEGKCSHWLEFICFLFFTLSRLSFYRFPSIIFYVIAIAKQYSFLSSSPNTYYSVAGILKSGTSFLPGHIVCMCIDFIKMLLNFNFICRITNWIENIYISSDENVNWVSNVYTAHLVLWWNDVISWKWTNIYLYEVLMYWNNHSLCQNQCDFIFTR